jgi:hypothetical protein
MVAGDINSQTNESNTRSVGTKFLGETIPFLLSAMHGAITWATAGRVRKEISPHVSS